MTRLTVVSTCVISVLAFSAAGALRPSSEVTVILDFKGPHSSAATREMQEEASLILKEADVSLSWRPLSGASDATYNDVAVMTFTGSCDFTPDPPVYDEPGPYARASMVNGKVQPFGRVECARVVRSVRDAMAGSMYGSGNQLLGRALGRVVAHELVHMLTRSAQHSRDGVMKASLSGRQLISGSLRLDKEDVLRLRQCMNGWRSDEPEKTCGSDGIEAENRSHSTMNPDAMRSDGSGGF